MASMAQAAAVADGSGLLALTLTPWVKCCQIASQIFYSPGAGFFRRKATILFPTDGACTRCLFEKRHANRAI
jgi:hypothetical protein